jgi:outer membrane protein OmpA-like peptidoglycan-associated protein
MMSHAQRGRAARRVGLAALLAVALSGCLTSPPQPEVSSGELPFDQAVAEATDNLVAQTQKLPAFLSRVESKVARRGVVVDPMVETGTGQQTAATLLLERRVLDRIGARHELFEAMPFEPGSLAKAQYLLTGTMARAQAGNKGAFRVNLALTELKSGSVVAHASALARDDGLDNRPTAYYRDSPVLVKDRVTEGYIRTTAAAPGARADSQYFEQVNAAPLIREADAQYNAERYQEALGRYSAVAAMPTGAQMRVLNGVYLANVKLGKSAEAEQSFGKLVAFGIAYRELGVKFLFNPGSTEFWSDSRVSGAYPMWLRQIARESTAAKACMEVVGHTSRTGSEPFNEQLSRQRAEAIRQRLASEAPELATRTRTAGMGFRQNIVGSGTDDLTDVLDRRVEFKIVPCG